MQDAATHWQFSPATKRLRNTLKIGKEIGKRLMVGQARAMPLAHDM
jgi:hypothetical protein